MDSITHTIIGACLGEVIAGKRLGKKAMLIGAIANNLPDIDVLTSLWMTHPDALLAHRGFTHSILFALIFSPLIAFLFQRFSKNKSVAFKTWLLLIGSGIFLHIFIDAFTAYGTGWFEPFSHARVSFNTLFILDPVFSLPVLVGAVALLLIRKKSPARIKWAKAGLYISSVYLIIACTMKVFIDSRIKKSFAVQDIRYDDYLTTPTPLNIFLWYIISKEDNHFYTGYYSVFDKNPEIKYQRVERNDSLNHTDYNSDDLKKIIRFSQGYYSISEVDHEIVFNDMRFGQMGGWNGANAPFVFTFSMKKNNDNSLALQQRRFKSISSESLKILWERIKGNNEE